MDDGSASCTFRNHDFRGSLSSSYLRPKSLGHEIQTNSDTRGETGSFHTPPITPPQNTRVYKPSAHANKENGLFEAWYKYHDQKEQETEKVFYGKSEGDKNFIYEHTATRWNLSNAPGEEVTLVLGKSAKGPFYRSSCTVSKHHLNREADILLGSLAFEDECPSPTHKKMNKIRPSSDVHESQGRNQPSSISEPIPIPTIRRFANNELIQLLPLGLFCFVVLFLAHILSPSGDVSKVCLCIILVLIIACIFAWALLGREAGS